ncbi:MAG TPA: tetraacyldisaccharide 4'-kinase [Casimicrobiaceae bacterium]
MDARLARDWYRSELTPLTAALTPLALLFGAVVAARRALYRAGWLRSARVTVPVIVVGNVTVGGGGKTPLVRALVEALRERGWRPGIVSRGYGGSMSGAYPVGPDDDPARVGDEPVLLAGSAPVTIGADRVAAARALIAAHPDVNVIVSDDGLQHYALRRDVEIVAIDATRGFGNGWLLPAGPLREPARRAREADARVHTLSGSDRPLDQGGFRLDLAALPWRSVDGFTAAPDFTALPRGSVHAVAGIANPQRFFDMLAAMRIDAVTHAFPDHHPYTAHDLEFAGARAVLMTEKDAVKCRRIADARMFWLPLRASIDPALVDLIEDRLHGSQAARAAGVPRHQGASDL